MCGRYELNVSKQSLMERYQLKGTEEDVSAREEIFPTNRCPVIVPGPDLVTLKWGFIESFAKRPLINARQETILQKPTFRDSFMHARCLIPATAFFEWEKEGNAKVKHRIAVKGLPIFSLAGIRKTYPQADGTILETFAIITTDATPAFAHIHDRMPVLLQPEDEARYLNHEVPPTEVKKFLTAANQLGFELVVD